MREDALMGAADRGVAVFANPRRPISLEGKRRRGRFGMFRAASSMQRPAPVCMLDCIVVDASSTASRHEQRHPYVAGKLPHVTCDAAMAG